MIDNKTILALEFDKILSKVKNFAVLNSTKKILSNISIDCDFDTCKYLLNRTNEAYKLLYTYGAGSIEYFDDFTDELERVKKGSILNFSELLKVARLLRSLRIAVTSIQSITDESIVYLREDTMKIYYNFAIEREIFDKILSEDTIADNASERLYSIRQAIKRINERIHEKLSEFIRKDNNKYLQDAIISIRNGRYVLPVKSEYRQNVKGFIHDKSQSGSTLFIEPTAILDLNNDLKNELLNEKAEIERILAELSDKISLISDKLCESLIYLTNIDLAYSKAQYSYSIKGIYPILTSNGEIDVKYGRHPLIDREKVVPISINLGKDYNYVLITGPNTGGKTVTLKLIGLFTLMAMSGIFLPAFDDTKISVFKNIFVDIGDEQSIEQSLSTFSSHLKNIIQITNNVDTNSLVLIDEIGAGTDPEEGSALAKALLNTLIEKGSYGVVTTHYSSLKEFAFTKKQIINASMDFDADTFMPLYKIRIGTPGTSNAIEIAKRLGLNESIYNMAKENLTNEKRQFDNILLEAEKVRFQAEKDRIYIQKLKEEQQQIYDNLVKEKEKFNKDKKAFLEKAKLEARKLYTAKLDKAEEMLEEIKDIYKKQQYTTTDVVKTSTLKNNIEKDGYLLNQDEETITPYVKADINALKKGDNVYIKTLSSKGVVDEVNVKKKTVWVTLNQARINCKIEDLEYIETPKQQNNKVSAQVSIKKASVLGEKTTEINVIGKDSEEALMLVDAFIDKGVMQNLEVIRVVHGKGLKILATKIHQFLKTDKRVKEYRFGKYGEGEDGVTIITLK